MSLPRDQYSPGPPRAEPRRRAPELRLYKVLRNSKVVSKRGLRTPKMGLTSHRKASHRPRYLGSQVAKRPLYGRRQYIGLGFAFDFAFGDARMPRPMGVHRCRSIVLRCFAGRSWGALRGAVHKPLVTRLEATASKSAPRHEVEQEHQRDRPHRQHGG